MTNGAARYCVRREIARGGWGIVLEADDLWARRRVALKLLSPSLATDTIAIARLLREGRVMRELAHPNICAVFDQGICEDGRPYLVMEHLDGETLRSLLKRSETRRLDVESAVEIAVQLLSALDAVHASAVIHRDVKPDNIILGRRSHAAAWVKLIDFGVCFPKEQSREASPLTGSWCVVGTPAYMAPEIALGDRMFDERVDLYSLGLVLYEMLTGHRFTTKRTELAQIVMRPPPPPLRAIDPTLPYALERVLARSLENDPRRRYPSAKAFLHDLLEARTAARAARPISRSRITVAVRDDEAPTRVLSLEPSVA